MSKSKSPQLVKNRNIATAFLIAGIVGILAWMIVVASGDLVHNLPCELNRDDCYGAINNAQYLIMTPFIIFGFLIALGTVPRLFPNKPRGHNILSTIVFTFIYSAVGYSVVGILSFMSR